MAERFKRQIGIHVGVVSSILILLMFGTESEEALLINWFIFLIPFVVSRVFDRYTGIQANAPTDK